MTDSSPVKAISVVLLVAVITSSLVSLAVVALRPAQEINRKLEQTRHVIGLAGLVANSADLSSDQLRELLDLIEVRVVDIDRACFTGEADTGVSTPIPAEFDLARLKQRPRFAEVYLVQGEGRIKRVILPIHGMGMWSRLSGYVALEADLDTIAAATFHEQAETPGLGSQITQPEWLAKWRGKHLYDTSGTVRFAVAAGAVDPASNAALHEVDAISGATVTANAVSATVAYWFGPHAWGPFLQWLRHQPANEQALRMCPP
jgi:Na+-transporting NADH:ubiquinone oxidoreductase subunit C